MTDDLKIKRVVYIIKHTKSDFKYIGSTKNSLKQRLYQHKNSGNVVGHNMAENNFTDYTIEVLEEFICDRKQIIQFEEYYIKYTKGLNNMNHAFGNRCEHGRERSQCPPCGGSQICEHGRIRSQCPPCGGASICEHGRIRNTCPPCGGASICEHGRRRNTCPPCGGSQICEHGRIRNDCNICSPVECHICFKIYSKNYINQHLKTHK